LPQKRTRQTQKEETRERIRGAAHHLFSSVGFDETTTKAVATEASVGAGTIFIHARDKTDLLFLVMHDLLAAAVDRGFASIAPTEPLAGQLMTVFGSLFAMYGENPRLASAFVKLLSSADGPNGKLVSQLTFEFLGRIAALVSEAQARGEIDDDVPPLLLAQNLFALYFFSLYTWLSGFATLETALDPQLRMSIELQLRGCEARERPAQGLGGRTDPG